MKILLTGVSGFVGSRLLSAICNLYGSENVVILSSKEHLKYTFVKYNVDFSILEEDFQKISKVEIVIHAGAYIPKNRIDSDHVEKCNGNILFTNSLLKLPLPKLKKIIYLSTVDVYSSSPLITELSAINPSSLYGYSKLYCEKMISSYCQKMDVKDQVLRIGHVYGPGEGEYEKLLPIVIKNIIAKRDVELWGDGSELRTFIYIDDAISACCSSIELEDNVGVINVVESKSISIYNLIKKIENLSCRSANLIQKSYSGNKRNLLFDNSKMKKYILKSEVEFDQGIKNEIDYFKTLL